jgi:hypothetical protein
MRDHEPSAETIAELTDAQRRRNACVRCGRLPHTPRKVRSRTGAEFIVCADEHSRVCTKRVFWLTQPCPPWCSQWHDDNDDGEDRTHMSDWNGKVPLVLEDGVEYRKGQPYQPEYASICLVQDVREIEPRIWCGKGQSNHGWHMTPAETRELAATLTLAADMADGRPQGARDLRVA